MIEWNKMVFMLDVIAPRLIPEDHIKGPLHVQYLLHNKYCASGQSLHESINIVQTFLYSDC
jgi:hypothetical protein